jgi:hypothetical protein
MEEIARWLEKLGMSEYAERFVEHQVTFSALLDFTDADLKNLGVVLGDRRRILRAISRVDATPEAAVLRPKPSCTLRAAQGSPTSERSSGQRNITLDGIAQATEGENPRAKYHRLIADTVKGLDSSTPEARQVIYEQARAALIAHLRLNQHRLLEADIVSERLALEEAIREVEAEAAQKSRTEMPPPAARPATSPASTTNGSSHQSRQGDGNPAPADLPETRGPVMLPDEQSLETGRRSREVVGEVQGFAGILGTAAQTGPYARQAQPLNRADFDKRQERDHGPYGSGNEQLLVAPPLQFLSHSAAPEDERSSRAQRALARFLVVMTSAILVMATILWQWSAITEFYQFLSRTGLESRRQVSHKTPTTISGGVAPEQNSAGPRGATVPPGQTVPPVGQRVVLYEEDPADPQGKRYAGSAIWRMDTGSNKPGLAPELAIRADVTIPERRMAMTWSLRRNTEKEAPPSYTIETMFNLPADIQGGGIANVPGILMKHSEQARGTVLAGLAVKVMNGYFIIEVSADDSNAQRNEQLLKDGSWFDIPIVYTNGMRAILAMEKGSQGDRIFAEAFSAWEKNEK